jgi:hypothetical protein
MTAASHRRVPPPAASLRFAAMVAALLAAPHHHGAGFGTPAATWVACVIRCDGQVAILRRRPGTTTVLRDWQPVGVVVPGNPAERTTAMVRNVLQVEATDSALALRVNGAETARVPRADHPLEGLVGFHVGPSVNVHVTTLDVTCRSAPPRPAAPPAAAH